jgi:rhodanese-related sulfurtransferase
MSISTITPQALAALCKDGQTIAIIDVRTPAEYRALHAVDAQNLPLGELNPAALVQARGGSTTEPLYMICQSGGRSRQACELFLGGMPSHGAAVGRHVGLRQDMPTRCFAT